MRKVLFFAALLCCLSVSAKRVGVYCFLDNAPQHLYEDQNVKVAIAVGGTDLTQLVIYNKTDNVIYVDKENSFAYTNDVPENLFKNSSQTTGKANTSGASVNLGGIAGALGIGGALGTLAGGINVGGSTTYINNTTVYEKRIVSIAPKSVAILYNWEPCMELLDKVNCIAVYSRSVFAEGLQEKRKNAVFIDPNWGTEMILQKGAVRNYDANSSPIRYKAVVRYSTNESFNTHKQVTIDNFISDIVIDSYKGIKNPHASLPYCQQYKNKQCTRFQAGKMLTTTEWYLVAGGAAFLIGYPILLSSYK